MLKFDTKCSYILDIEYGRSIPYFFLTPSSSTMMAIRFFGFLFCLAQNGIWAHALTHSWLRSAGKTGDHKNLINFSNQRREQKVDLMGNLIHPIFTMHETSDLFTFEKNRNGHKQTKYRKSRGTVVYRIAIPLLFCGLSFAVCITKFQEYTMNYCCFKRFLVISIPAGHFFSLTSQMRPKFRLPLR